MGMMMASRAHPASWRHHHGPSRDLDMLWGAWALPAASASRLLRQLVVRCFRSVSVSRAAGHLTTGWASLSGWQIPSVAGARTGRP